MDIKFPAGTPIDDVMSVIELLAKESVGNDKKVIELIKIVSEGAHKGDGLLLEGINELAKSVAALIKDHKRLTDTVNGSVELIKELHNRISYLESKGERTH